MCTSTIIVTHMNFNATPPSYVNLGVALKGRLQRGGMAVGQMQTPVNGGRRNRPCRHSQSGTFYSNMFCVRSPWMPKCELLFICMICATEYNIHSFIHSGDLYSASSRDYYSEALRAQSRTKKKDFRET